MSPWGFPPFIAASERAKRASLIDPPASSYAIMRRARPYRGENHGPGKDFHRELDPTPGIREHPEIAWERPHWLAGHGGFELSDPEKPPVEHGLTATEGRSARYIHCRMDWTGVQVTFRQLSREKSLIAKRSEMKGNSGHTSKANFGSNICEFKSSHPSQAMRSHALTVPGSSFQPSVALPGRDARAASASG